MPSIKSNTPPEYESWLNGLEVGQLVDLEHIFPNRRDVCSAAQVQSNGPPNGDIVVTWNGERLAAAKIGLYAGATKRGQIVPHQITSEFGEATIGDD